jgi:hypothetical protein
MVDDSGAAGHVGSGSGEVEDSGATGGEVGGGERPPGGVGRRLHGHGVGQVVATHAGVSQRQRGPIGVLCGSDLAHV